MSVERANSISLFVTGGVIPFGTIPKWSLNNESTAYTGHYTCARIICESKPELELTELLDLERIGITQENISTSERETVSIVCSSLEKSDRGYIVRLPFKDDSRPSVNYRNAKGQLNSLMQRVSQDENLGKQYNEIVNRPSLHILRKILSKKSSMNQSQATTCLIIQFSKRALQPSCVLSSMHQVSPLTVHHSTIVF